MNGPKLWKRVTEGGKFQSMLAIGLKDFEVRRDDKPSPQVEEGKLGVLGEIWLCRQSTAPLAVGQSAARPVYLLASAKARQACRSMQESS
jgi:hypothetical protein